MNLLIITLILVNVLSLTDLTKGQQKLFFGLNADIDDPIYQRIIVQSNSEFKELFAEYGIKFIRFPGGIPTRYFFWDNQELSSEALDLLSSYLKKRGNRRGDIYEKKAGRYKLPKDIYKSFLSFCKKTDIIPVIQLNTSYYISDNKVYPFENFIKNYPNGIIKDDRWDKIEKYIEAQLKFTHTYFDTVYWEFGNEDGSLYEAEIYGKIVTKLTSIVRKLYPSDIIIVQLAPIERRNGEEIDWNDPLIEYLNKNNVLSQIDYFAPHLYDEANKTLDTQKEITDKITSKNVINFEKTRQSSFPKNYVPKFFVTEFAPFLKSYNNADFNTQLHALMMLNYLMKFSGAVNITGVALHGFTGRSNAIFFDTSLTNIYSKYYKSSAGGNKLFYYISPQAKAIKLFFSTTGNFIKQYTETDHLLILVSKNDDEEFIQILNFSDKIQKSDLSKYISGIGKNEITAKTYVFNDLNEHSWELLPENILIESNSNAPLPAHSFTIIRFKSK